MKKKFGANYKVLVSLSSASKKTAALFISVLYQKLSFKRFVKETKKEKNFW